MTESYESYRAVILAQEVTPMTREAWEREVELAKPHTVEFTVTPEMAKIGILAAGNYCNYFGDNHALIKTVKV